MLKKSAIVGLGISVFGVMTGFYIPCFIALFVLALWGFDVL